MVPHRSTQKRTKLNNEEEEEEWGEWEWEWEQSREGKGREADNLIHTVHDARVIDRFLEIKSSSY